MARLVAEAPADAEVWLDGGHNPHCAAAVSRAIADLDEKVDRPLYLICAMLKTKDAVGFLSRLQGLGATCCDGFYSRRGRQHGRGRPL